MKAKQDTCITHFFTLRFVVFLTTFLDLTGLFTEPDLIVDFGFVEAVPAGPFAGLLEGFLPNAVSDLPPSNLGVDFTAV